MMDQNLGRFDTFEVDDLEDPYPDSHSHLHRQLRVIGDSILLRSPGITLSGIERELGCKWYQKNIRNAALPGNVYASRLECSLHEIDETRRAVSILYQQIHKFGHQAIPQIFCLLVGPHSKSAILELYVFLKNLQHNLSVFGQCVPGQNSGIKLQLVASEDPICWTNYCLLGRLLLSVSEVVLCCKCPDISSENFHLVLEFGDDLLRIAFLMMRFTYDVRPAIGSAILKYGNYLGSMISQSSRVTYEEIKLRPGPYIPFFRIGEKTDADTVRQQLIRLRSYLHTELKYSIESTMDLIDECMIIGANGIIFQALVILDNLVGLWFCKQFRYKKQLARIARDQKLELIDELADVVYHYNDPNAAKERQQRFDTIKYLEDNMCSFLSVMITTLTNQRTHSVASNDHPAISANRKRTIAFLIRIFDRLKAILSNPVQFADSLVGPFAALYKEQDAYMNKLVYERLAIGTSNKALPLLKRPIYIEEGRLTTKNKDIDRLMCLERWPKDTIIRLEEE